MRACLDDELIDMGRAYYHACCRQISSVAWNGTAIPRIYNNQGATRSVAVTSIKMQNWPMKKLAALFFLACPPRYLANYICGLSFERRLLRW